tara:strand:- start:65 stop:985 length:921 start_codon:yes stop_codon:yes gene_type:complete
VKNILITPQGFYFIKNKIKDHLNDKFNYVFSNGIIENKDELINSISDCEIAIVGSEIIDRDIIDAGKNLELIIRFGTSTENIDKEYLLKKNIKLHSIKSIKTVEGVARLCVLFSTFYIFNVHKHARDAQKGHWKRYMNLSPENIKIGLLGAGDIASVFYNFGSALGFNFNYFSRTEKLTLDKKSVTFYENINDLIEASDIVSIHLPYNSETKNLLGSDQFNLLKNKMLINTSRAGIVCKESLIRALNKYTDFYYFTDVLHSEPPLHDDLEIIKMKNVVSTAHIGGYSESALIDVALKSLEIIKNET